MNALRKMQGGDAPASDPRESLRQLIERNRKPIHQALPAGINPDRMIQIAQTAILSNPDITVCTKQSLLLSLIRCAQLGLEPNTPLGHAYLVPFRKNIGTRQDPHWVSEATLILGYKGLINLVWRTDKILVEAELVHEVDDFECHMGLDAVLRHIPANVDDPGKVIAAYSIARLPDGRSSFCMMWRREIDRIMLQTQFKGKKGPWKDHRGEMQKKTVIKRHMKRLPLSTDVNRMHEVDGVAGPDPEITLVTPDEEPPMMLDEGRELPTLDIEPESLDIIPPTDNPDWTAPDMRDAAYQCIVEAMADRPTEAKDIASQNQRIINFLTPDQKADVSRVASAVACDTMVEKE